MPRSFDMKDCVRCGEPYIPRSASAKYCKPCRPLVRKEHTKRQNCSPTQLKRYREYQMERYDMLFRHQSKIVHRPDFIAFIKKKILERRGDLLSVKPMIVQAVEALDLDYNNSEIAICYRTVEDMCRSLGGVEYGKSARKGRIFQWEREK